MLAAQLSRVITALLLTVAVSSSAQADEWKVTLTKLTVKPTKLDGTAWDANGSPPDPFGNVSVGLWDSDCKPKETELIPLHKNDAEFDVGLVLTVDRPKGLDLCLAIELNDDDGHDRFERIGRASQKLVEGESDVTVGQATVHVIVAAIKSAATAHRVREPRTEGLYRVTVVSARLHATRADGTTWDEPNDPSIEPPDVTEGLLKMGLQMIPGPGGMVLRSLFGTSEQRPHVDPTATYKAKKVSEPDPFVRLKLGTLTFTTPFHWNTFTPMFDSAVIIPASALAASPARIEVFDKDDGEDEPMGSDLITEDQLLSGQIVRLSFGAVEELLLSVEHVKEKADPIVKKGQIAAAQWANADVNVFAGQSVEITATGKTCIKPDQCLGPNGDKKVIVYKADNVQVHLGQFIAIIAGRVIPIGAHRVFTAGTSGPLMVGFANPPGATGTADVSVQVFYPVQTVAVAPKAAPAAAVVAQATPAAPPVATPALPTVHHVEPLADQPVRRHLAFKNGATTGEDELVERAPAPGSNGMSIDGIYCGSDRVEVKHMIDSDAGSVDLTPIPKSIDEFRSMPAPKWHATNPRDDFEKHVYAVSGRITGLGLESDNDIHVIIEGPSGSSMVVKLVEPKCAKDSPVAQAIAAIRKKWIDTLGTPPSSIRLLETPIEGVTIKGVGFWDKVHNGNGRAPNSIELHPVLDVEGL